MKSPLSVLLAEDNDDDLFLSQRVLAKAGVAPVFHVADGKEAIDYLSGQGEYADRVRHPFPAVMLLDLKMPGFSGHEVLEWLRAQPALCALKVFVLTSSGETRDRERVEKAGAQGYFVKPLTSAAPGGDTGRVSVHGGRRAPALPFVQSGVALCGGGVWGGGRFFQHTRQPYPTCPLPITPSKPPINASATASP